ncbi:MAG: DUF1800 family protein [bacterium]
MENTLPPNLHYVSKYAALRTPKQRLHTSGTVWGQAQAQHLLIRAAFGGTPAEIAAAGLATREEIVEKLLADVPMPDPPGPDDWVNEGYVTRGLTTEQRRELQRLNRFRFSVLRSWWLELMANNPYSLREKMVVFWHGHFATEAQVVVVAQMLYKHNDMLRRNALGNFRTFLKEMWRDPAMLVYLNGVQNRVGNPNENFARELMELFTMGVDQYTETDIKEAARAFTGWQVNDETIESELSFTRYDSFVKTFLGQTGNFNGDNIIDIILEQPVTAKFICTKLYKYFVNFEVDETHVDELAAIFRDNEYEIKPVLRKIFTSDYFYAEENVGSIIKSPAHLVVSTVRQLGAPDADLSYLFNAADLLDQALFSPPNVAGWPGQRAWISPFLLASRSAFGESAILGGRIDRNLDNKNLKPIKTDIMAFARSFGIDRPRELLDKWIEHFMSIALDDLTKESLLSILLEGAAEDDWSLNFEGVEDRVANCLTQMLRLPEYQLT